MSMTKGLKSLARAPVRDVLTTQRLVEAGLPAASLAGVDETTARKLSAVDACMEILSNSMGKLPAYVMNKNTRERINHPILELLNVRPNEAMAPSVRKKLLETSRLEGGNSYDWIIRDPRTMRPIQLIPLPWRIVSPWQDETGRVWYTVFHPLTGEPRTLPQEDVCHYKGLTQSGYVGVSVLRRASEVISAGLAAQRYEMSYYQNGGRPAGVLKTQTDLGGYVIGPDGTPIKDEFGALVTKKDRLRNEWDKVYSGPDNTYKTAVLDFGLDYTPIASSNKDAQFVESKDVSVRDIARYFGVPLYKLQEGKQAYGSNEQNAIEYVVSTLHPIVTQYEEEQTWKLLPRFERQGGLEIDINMMAELKGDTASRGFWYQTMSEIGGFSVNNILQLEDMPDVEGGDERKASLNYVPLSLWRELSIKRNWGTGGDSSGKD